MCDPPRSRHVSDTEDIERHRSPEHLRFVGSLCCIVCRIRPPNDPHHLKFMAPRAMKLKAGDQWTVPMCRRCHKLVELSGDERRWWMAMDIDPVPLARELWLISRWDAEEARRMLDLTILRADRTA